MKSKLSNKIKILNLECYMFLGSSFQIESLELIFS